MGQKIIQIGSSKGVTIPAAMLKKLGLKIGDGIELSHNSRKSTIEISKTDNSKDNQSVFSAVKEIVDEYQDEFAKIDE